MLTLRDAVPATDCLRKAEFATLRLRLLKLGARVTETASRVRVAFTAACPESELFRHLAGALQPGAPWRQGRRCPQNPNPLISNACHQLPDQRR